MEELIEAENNKRKDARSYVCSDCNTIVRARWHTCGSFEVGCDCTTIPIVPQIGQAETPDNWIVKREECCDGVDVTTLDSYYGERGDFKCPTCTATYDWNGEMVIGPDEDTEE